MSLYRYCRSVYALDTLDTRFSVSSTTPLSRKNDDNGITDTKLPSQTILDGSEGRKPLPTAQPSKWNTYEFYFYYVCFIIFPFLMAKSVYDVSQPGSPNWENVSQLLSDGWVPGRKVDNSDQQYQSFRNNIPYLAILVVVHPMLRKLYGKFWRIDSYTKVRSDDDSGLSMGLSPSAAADARMQHRISFDFGFALIFISALHGVSAVKILLILYANYKIATGLPKNYVPAATWVFNVGILFTNELCNGYRFSALARLLLPSQTSAAGNEHSYANWGTWVDSQGGLIPRWEILFNITVLRLISFNFDYCWSLDQNRGSSAIEKQLDPANLSERDRVSISAKPTDYSLYNYIAYTLYAPLYLTGPILTFNDYISQNRYPVATISTSRTIKYGIRFLLTLLCMELVLHYLYAVAVSKARPNWSLYSPFQLAMLGYFNLHIIWLKLLIPWRFFRLWALIDGIDPPENMVRCISDTYSALAFWRGWHRSFNRWIVRYIYIPMGGNSGGKLWAVVNLFTVFTFVALWHDISLRLLVWGWMITLFVLPEIVATLLFPPKKWRDRPNTYRVLCGIGAVGNALMMMAANLVGFAIGLDGLKEMVMGIVGSWGGLWFFVASCGVLFVGFQVDFEHREEEKRQGYDMKC